jgi:cobalt-zinc-cadmium efflux system membrane fusion protein
MATSSLPTSPASVPQSRAATLANWLVEAMPTALVMALLLGVLYFGHHSGWKLPKFAALFGTPVSDFENKDWCDEHSVPDSICVECQVDLLPKGKPFGWCKVHGVMECPEHHPELYQGRKGEPRLPKYDTAAALAVLPRPENNSISTLHQTRLQFASEASVAKAGVDVAVVEEGPMRDAIAAAGEVTFAPTHVAHLASRVPGMLTHVRAGLGDRVQAGQVLALVDAGAVGQAKSQLLQAISMLQVAEKNLARLSKVADGIGRKQLQEAEAALQEAQIGVVTARQALVNLGFDVPQDVDQRDPRDLVDEMRFLGLPTDLAASLEGETKTANLMPIVAPQAGEIVQTHVVAGEVVGTDTTLFTIADPDRMWLTLHVPAEQARFVKRGQKVEFTTDDGSQRAAGQIEWISPAVDPKSRTLQARVPLDNRETNLRDQSYGTAQVILREEPNAIVVPKVAVHSTGDTYVVFVRDKHYFDEQAPKLFYVRQVRLGAASDTQVELLAGALPGEEIASQGSAVLLAQLLRSQLGAGCGCHE